MKHGIKLLFVLSLLFCKQATANPSMSIGIGPQYAGFIGYQLANVKDGHKVRGSLGLLGVSVGYEYLVTPKIGLGGGFFRYHDVADDLSGFGFNANYYFNSAEASGIVIGLDVLNQTPRESTPSDSKDGVVVFFSAGYQF